MISLLYTSNSYYKEKKTNSQHFLPELEIERKLIDFARLLRFFFTTSNKKETKSVVILQHVDMKPIFSYFFKVAVKQNEIFKGQCHVVLALPDNDSVAGHIAKENYSQEQKSKNAY